MTDTVHPATDDLRNGLIVAFLRHQVGLPEFVLRYGLATRSRRAAATHGALALIGGLCDSYQCALPTGCGYRVSEAQFRRAVQSLAKTHPPLDAEPH